MKLDGNIQSPSAQQKHHVDFTSLNYLVELWNKILKQTLRVFESKLKSSTCLVCPCRGRAFSNHIKTMQLSKSNRKLFFYLNGDEYFRFNTFVDKYLMAIHQAARKRGDFMQKLFPFLWISIYQEVECKDFTPSEQWRRGNLPSFKLTHSVLKYRFPEKRNFQSFFPSMGNTSIFIFVQTNKYVSITIKNEELKSCLKSCLKSDAKQLFEELKWNPMGKNI